MTNQTQKRIDEIKSEPRALIGTDEGTHVKPTTYRLYEEISGERYAVKSFGGATISRCTVADADETDGRIRMFPGEMTRMATLRAELRRLEASLRDQAPSRVRPATR